ncbi:MAG: hypothetical protein DMF95_25765 [Acidobacteria bacterium]|nr:MAG: hypothetical protein DMF95_25765 [Acidobacteriota bacterium]
MGTGDWGLGIGDWGLGTGDWGRTKDQERTRHQAPRTKDQELAKRLRSRSNGRAPAPAVAEGACGIGGARPVPRCRDDRRLGRRSARGGRARGCRSACVRLLALPGHAGGHRADHRFGRRSQRARGWSASFSGQRPRENAVAERLADWLARPADRGGRGTGALDRRSARRGSPVGGAGSGSRASGRPVLAEGPGVAAT